MHNFAIVRTRYLTCIGHNASKNVCLLRILSFVSSSSCQLLFIVYFLFFPRPFFLSTTTILVLLCLFFVLYPLVSCNLIIFPFHLHIDYRHSVFFPFLEPLTLPRFHFTPLFCSPELFYPTFPFFFLVLFFIIISNHCSCKMPTRTLPRCRQCLFTIVVASG